MRKFELHGHFIVDVIGLLYAVKSLLDFTRYSTNIRNEMLLPAHMFVPNFLEYVSAKNWQNIHVNLHMHMGSLAAQARVKIKNFQNKTYSPVLY